MKTPRLSKNRWTRESERTFIGHMNDAVYALSKAADMGEGISGITGPNQARALFTIACALRDLYG